MSSYLDSLARRYFAGRKLREESERAQRLGADATEKELEDIGTVLLNTAAEHFEEVVHEDVEDAYTAISRQEYVKAADVWLQRADRFKQVRAIAQIRTRMYTSLSPIHKTLLTEFIRILDTSDDDATVEAAHRRMCRLGLTEKDIIEAGMERFDTQTPVTDDVPARKSAVPAAQNEPIDVDALMLEESAGRTSPASVADTLPNEGEGHTMSPQKHKRRTRTTATKGAEPTPGQAAAVPTAKRKRLPTLRDKSGVGIPRADDWQEGDRKLYDGQRCDACVAENMQFCATAVKGLATSCRRCIRRRQKCCFEAEDAEDASAKRRCVELICSGPLPWEDLTLADVEIPAMPDVTLQHPLPLETCNMSWLTSDEARDLRQLSKRARMLVTEVEVTMSSYRCLGKMADTVWQHALEREKNNGSASSVVASTSIGSGRQARSGKQ